jgi:hypothetical protein
MVRFTLAIIAAALMAAFGSPAAASAEPGCASETVRVQGEIVPAPVGATCDSDSDDSSNGLLGNAPVVGNLPGLGGVL